MLDSAYASKVIFSLLGIEKLISAKQGFLHTHLVCLLSVKQLQSIFPLDDEKIYQNYWLKTRQNTYH